jgi:hypothetical protein
MADGELRREVAALKSQLLDCCQKVKKDITNLERELVKLKEEMRATMLKAELVAPLPIAKPASPGSRRQALLYRGEYEMKLATFCPSLNPVITDRVRRVFKILTEVQGHQCVLILIDGTIASVIIHAIADNVP